MPIQLKNLMPVGTAMSRLRSEKNGSSTAPVVNMWWAHTPVDSAAMAMVAPTIPLYPNTGLREKTGRHFGHDAEVRQGQDVDLGVPEEPEEVLPQQR